MQEKSKGVYQKGVWPIAQEVDLLPDMEKWIFSGNTSIKINLDEPVSHIDLNAFNLTIKKCKLGDKVLEYENDNDEEERRLRVFLPEKIKGEIVLDIEFNGTIYSEEEGLRSYNLAGLYRSRYDTGGDDDSAFITSQCEENDCCQIFPCFDHPAAKAVFSIKMIIPKDLTVVSCMDIEEEIFHEDGKKTVIFHPAHPMSTYLLYFGAGKFETISKNEKIHFRAITPPGKIKYAEDALETMIKAVKDLENRLDSPYPLPKLDIIAVPEFMFGAMENWGVLAHRETYMLNYPETTTEEALGRMIEVINHEVVHQWFGNLVSPADWKYIWLNETLASYFGVRLKADHYPDWPVWADFILEDHFSAIDRGAFIYNFPTELPDGSDLSITASTAPIVYDKGACLFRQAIDFLGDEKIRQGLSHYLKKHRYGNTKSEDFYESLKESAGIEIDRVFKQWIERAGYPLLTVSRKGNALRLSQKRHTYLPNDDQTIWPIPIKYTIWKKDGSIDSRSVIMEEKEMAIELPADLIAYKLNMGQTGFYRVNYPLKDLAALLDSYLEDLNPEDAQGIMSDCCALVKSGDLKDDAYFALLEKYLPRLRSYLPLMSAANDLLSLSLDARGSSLKKIKDLGKRLAEDTLAEIGFEGGDMAAKNLRAKMIAAGVIFDSSSIKIFTVKMYTKYLKCEKIVSSLRLSVLKAAAYINNNRTVLEEMLEMYKKMQSEEERKDILIALGFFRDPAILESVCGFTVKNVPPGNQFIVFSSIAANPEAKSVLFEIFQKNEKQIKQFPNMSQQRIIISVCKNFFNKDISSIEKYFNAYSQNNDIKDAVSYGLEMVRINNK
jgi:aminopeptidase N